MPREDVLEKRRIAFEEWVAEDDNLWAHRSHGGDYVNTLTMELWRAWNAALDSVVIELPELLSGRSEYAIAHGDGVDDCASAIQQQGYRTK